MIVKPGYVKTKMIAGIETPKLLTVSPDFVAKKIYKGFTSKKDTIYVSSIWKFIMILIRNMPERIFKRIEL